MPQRADYMETEMTLLVWAVHLMGAIGVMRVYVKSPEASLKVQSLSNGIPLGPAFSNIAEYSTGYLQYHRTWDRLCSSRMATFFRFR